MESRDETHVIEYEKIVDYTQLKNSDFPYGADDFFRNPTLVRQCCNLIQLDVVDQMFSSAALRCISLLENTLQVLRLSSCGISDIDSLIYLNRLLCLDLSKNNICELPIGVRNFSKLQFFDVSYNLLKSDYNLKRLLSIPSLEEVILDCNPLCLSTMITDSSLKDASHRLQLVSGLPSNTKNLVRRPEKTLGKSPPLRAALGSHLSKTYPSSSRPNVKLKRSYESIRNKASNATSAYTSNYYDYSSSSLAQMSKLAILEAEIELLKIDKQFNERKGHVLGHNISTFDLKEKPAESPRLSLEHKYQEYHKADAPQGKNNSLPLVKVTPDQSQVEDSLSSPHLNHKNLSHNYVKSRSQEAKSKKKIISQLGQDQKGYNFNLKLRNKINFDSPSHSDSFSSKSSESSDSESSFSSSYRKRLKKKKNSHKEQYFSSEKRHLNTKLSKLKKSDTPLLKLNHQSTSDTIVSNERQSQVRNKSRRKHHPTINVSKVEPKLNHNHSSSDMSTSSSPVSSSSRSDNIRKQKKSNKTLYNYPQPSLSREVLKTSKQSQNLIPDISPNNQQGTISKSFVDFPTRPASQSLDLSKKGICRIDQKKESSIFGSIAITDSNKNHRISLPSLQFPQQPLLFNSVKTIEDDVFISKDKSDFVMAGGVLDAVIPSMPAMVFSHENLIGGNYFFFESNNNNNDDDIFKNEGQQRQNKRTISKIEDFNQTRSRPLPVFKEDLVVEKPSINLNDFIQFSNFVQHPNHSKSSSQQQHPLNHSSTVFKEDNLFTVNHSSEQQQQQMSHSNIIPNYFPAVQNSYYLPNSFTKSIPSDQQSSYADQSALDDVIYVAANPLGSKEETDFTETKTILSSTAKTVSLNPSLINQGCSNTSDRHPNSLSQHPDSNTKYDTCHDVSPSSSLSPSTIFPSFVRNTKVRTKSIAMSPPPPPLPPSKKQSDLSLVSNPAPPTRPVSDATTIHVAPITCQIQPSPPPFYDEEEDQIFSTKIGRHIDDFQVKPTLIPIANTAKAVSPPSSPQLLPPEIVHISESFSTVSIKAPSPDAKPSPVPASIDSPQIAHTVFSFANDSASPKSSQQPFLPPPATLLSNKEVAMNAITQAQHLLESLHKVRAYCISISSNRLAAALRATDATRQHILLALLAVSPPSISMLPTEWTSTGYTAMILDPTVLLPASNFHALPTRLKTVLETAILQEAQALLADESEGCINEDGKSAFQQYSIILNLFTAIVTASLLPSFPAAVSSSSSEESERDEENEEEIKNEELNTLNFEKSPSSQFSSQSPVSDHKTPVLTGVSPRISSSSSAPTQTIAQTPTLIPVSAVMPPHRHQNLPPALSSSMKSLPIKDTLLPATSAQMPISKHIPQQPRPTLPMASSTAEPLPAVPDSLESQFTRIKHSSSFSLSPPPPLQQQQQTSQQQYKYQEQQILQRQQRMQPAKQLSEVRDSPEALPPPPFPPQHQRCAPATAVDGGLITAPPSRLPLPISLSSIVRETHDFLTRQRDEQDRISSVWSTLTQQATLRHRARILRQMTAVQPLESNLIMHAGTQPVENRFIPLDPIPSSSTLQKAPAGFQFSLESFPPKHRQITSPPRKVTTATSPILSPSTSSHPIPRVSSPLRAAQSRVHPLSSSKPSPPIPQQLKPPPVSISVSRSLSRPANGFLQSIIEDKSKICLSPQRRLAEGRVPMSKGADELLLMPAASSKDFGDADSVDSNVPIIIRSPSSIRNDRHREKKDSKLSLSPDFFNRDVWNERGVEESYQQRNHSSKTLLKRHSKQIHNDHNNPNLGTLNSKYKSKLLPSPKASNSLSHRLSISRSLSSISVISVQPAENKSWEQKAEDEDFSERPVARQVTSHALSQTSFRPHASEKSVVNYASTHHITSRRKNSLSNDENATVILIPTGDDANSPQRPVSRFSRAYSSPSPRLPRANCQISNSPDTENKIETSRLLFIKKDDALVNTIFGRLNNENFNSLNKTSLPGDFKGTQIGFTRKDTISNGVVNQLW